MSSNNINKRIKNTTEDIILNKNKPLSSLTIKERLQPYTKPFTDLLKGKLPFTASNTSTNTSNTLNKNKEVSPFDNPVILSIIIFIALFFIVFGLYRYYSETSTIQLGKTYYGNDLLNYEPLFKMNTTKIEECINRCNLDTLCNGITYDDESQQCLGTKNGRIRNDTINYQAWVKSKEEDTSLRVGKLVGYANTRKMVDNKDIPRPRLPTEFNYSFYIYIEDFYDNQGSWKHIFHKGDELLYEKIINTPEWSDIIDEIPNQSIGVWVAPYNNNIRIAITTSSISGEKALNSEYKDAYKQEIYTDPNSNTNKIFISDISYGRFRDPTRNNIYDTNIQQQARISVKRQVEYIDIYRIPVKKLIHMSVNFTGMTMEVYMNGNLYKIHSLQGYPEFNIGNLYCMNDKTITGSIIDLKFTPQRLSHTKILEQTINMKDLENKTLKQIRKIAK